LNYGLTGCYSPYPKLPSFSSSVQFLNSRSTIYLCCCPTLGPGFPGFITSIKPERVMIKIEAIPKGSVAHRSGVFYSSGGSHVKRRN
jgi:hypothetical protein